LLRGVAARRRSQEEINTELEMYQKARDRAGKPMLAMFWTPTPYPDSTAMGELDQALQSFGIPTFPTPNRAARALKKTIDYYRFRQGLEETSVS
ncbi:uncharacterized protein METZ01_LOCUS215455, partial [marine metagenome]